MRLTVAYIPNKPEKDHYHNKGTFFQHIVKTLLLSHVNSMGAKECHQAQAIVPEDNCRLDNLGLGRTVQRLSSWEKTFDPRSMEYPKRDSLEVYPRTNHLNEWYRCSK